MQPDGVELDSTKTVIKIPGIRGKELARMLDLKRINIEKVNWGSILITIHTNINEDEIRLLAHHLVEIAQN